MKFLDFLVVLYLGCAVTVNAQTGGGVEMTTGLDTLHAQLQLKTDSIELRHCSGDYLQFNLRLNFTNRGKGPVILDKRSTVISQYMVSRSSEDANRKKHEIVVTPLIGLEAAGMTMELVPDESQFVVLKPSEIYSLDRVFNFHISIDGNDRDSLRVGHHVLQMVVLTWYYPRASNVEWRSVENQGGYHGPIL